MCKKKKMIKTMGFVLLSMGLAFTSAAQQTGFAMTENKAEQRVDITVDGKPFTSYLYPDQLKKPVLYPIYTTEGDFVTRGWPIAPRPGEPVDHPHHVGLWFNYGDVNGLDFWNNSASIPPERRHEYGTIKHAGIKRMQAGPDQAVLEVSALWQKPDGTSLLNEQTTYRFKEKDGQRWILLTVTLTALHEKVNFKDNKEGLIGLRVARALQQPSSRPERYVDAKGQVTQVAQLDNEGVTGFYHSSTGKQGDEVWGTRAKWVSLQGEFGGQPVAVVLFDHPENVGYPTYWHARGYGLFAANPLGQKEFSQGKEELNFSLAAGESAVFRYQLLIHAGRKLSDQELNADAADFADDLLP